MYSAYRVNYQLRAHKRDAFIEFCKGLLLTPFVLRIQPTVDPEDVPGTPHFVPGRERMQNFDFDVDMDDSDVEQDGQETKEETTKTPSSNTQKPQRIASFSNLRVPRMPPTKRTVLERYAEIWEAIEELIEEHMIHQANGVPQFSKLHLLVPSIGRFFTPLPLREAFLEQNRRRSITGRRFVAPSFNDIRHILNTAQVMAIAPQLKLITFDGDMTLYADGKNYPPDSPITEYFINMLRRGIHVAIVTAAGYPGANGARRYEERLGELLKALDQAGVGDGRNGRFFVLGGECNYLFKMITGGKLEWISEDQYLPNWVAKWSQDFSRINALLDVAEKTLKRSRRDMGLEDLVQVLRKERAVGLVVGENVSLDREQLDEFALGVQDALSRFQAVEKVKIEAEGKPWIPLPYCAFNGGSDVWVDIGNKLIGVRILREWLGASGAETTHIGDQFLATGNDISTRTACTTLWISSPEETAAVLDELNSQTEKVDKLPDQPARLRLETLPKHPARVTTLLNEI